MQGLSLELPAGYYLKHDPDLLTLHRQDGSLVGAFSARGVVPEAIRRTAEEAASPPAPSLRARFFGHFELLCDGEPVPLGRNGKVLTILKYLLANHPRPVSQDYLMGWLWPDSNLKKARWSLNSAVHGLRKLLKRGSSPPNLVLLEEGHYRLSPAVSVATDVDEFDARHERGRLLERTDGVGRAAAEYEAAVALYREDYLVEDLYEDWTMVERERLSSAYLEMLDRLGAYYAETGQHREAVRACYKVLEKDRCHEDSHRLLMRCYTRLGTRGRALRQYRLCERILREGYGTDPSPETKALFLSLLRDEDPRSVSRPSSSLLGRPAGSWARSW